MESQPEQESHGIQKLSAGYWVQSAKRWCGHKIQFLLLAGVHIPLEKLREELFREFLVRADFFVELEIVKYWGSKKRNKPSVWINPFVGIDLAA